MRLAEIANPRAGEIDYMYLLPDRTPSCHPPVQHAAIAKINRSNQTIDGLADAGSGRTPHSQCLNPGKQWSSKFACGVQNSDFHLLDIPI
jgi:hypothetical protein